MIAWSTTVRCARPRDAEALADLHRRSAAAGFTNIFSAGALSSVEELAQDWRRLLHSNSTLERVVLVAERDERIVGVLVAGRDVADHGIGTLSRAYIDPRFWNVGVALLLFDAAVAHLQELGCTRAKGWIVESNHRARVAATHVGLVPTGAHQPTCEKAATVAVGVDDLEYEIQLPSIRPGVRDLLRPP